MEDPYLSIPAIPRYREWLRNNTTVFSKVDVERSIKLAISARCKIKQCYANSARNAYGGLEYHEGFFRCPGIGYFVNHAFLVCDGVVVDPTIGIVRSTIESPDVLWIGKHIKDPILKMAKTRKFSPLLLDEYTKYYTKEV